MSADLPEWLQQSMGVAQYLHGEFSVTYHSQDDCWTIRIAGSEGSGYFEELSRCKTVQLDAACRALVSMVSSVFRSS